jgi:EsV-1-7 cysteine-rich motif
MLQAREYCVHHAVDVGTAVLLGAAARCRNHEACSKQANFGYRGERPIYCKTCIPEDLKDTLIDVRSQRCEHEGCDTQPSFGKPGDKVSAALFTAVFPEQ